MIKLGPITENTGLYEYSIVTDTNRGKLFVYARDVHTFFRYYKYEVLDFCRNNGFTCYYNWPRETPQPHVCPYEDPDDLMNERIFGGTGGPQGGPFMVEEKVTQMSIFHHQTPRKISKSNSTYIKF